MISPTWTLVVAVLPVIYLVGLAHGDCSVDTPVAVVQMSETDGVGSTLVTGTYGNESDLLNIAATATGLDTSQALNLTRNYFNVTRYAANFSVTLAKKLDLEEFYLNWFTIPVDIKDVNEYPPRFRNKSYATEIPESTPVNGKVFDFGPQVEDKDKGGNEKPNFHITDYKISEVRVFGADCSWAIFISIRLDGQTRFSLPLQSKGRIELTDQLDYDGLQQKFFILNITVTDSSGSDAKTAMTTLNISISDVDDQAPGFEFPGCSSPCTAPPYEAITKLDYVGDLTVTPNPIKAIDNDTLGTAMVYTIQSGNDAGLFHLDPDTGSLSQQKSVRDSGMKASAFRLVIQVRKNLTIDLSAIAIVTIAVKERMPFHNGTVDEPDPPPAEDDGGTDLLIPMIVLGVILALVIVAIVVVALIIRWKMKKAAITPADDVSVASYKMHKSEPATEEEEIFSDRSDQFMWRSPFDRQNGSSSATVNAMAVGTDAMFPTTAGNARPLPPLPLMDTGTETDAIPGKKKRPRNRKKKKLTETFDGTREYNMGADPSFYDSTDKAKVKRSHRSYDKNTDPLYWMKVPNDNTDETQ